MRVAALNAVAEAQGIFVGQLLADARALYPDLHIQDADAEADATALKSLSDWLSRYSPWTAPATGHNGTDGVLLDVTGCAHLFGGEEAMLKDLVKRLRRFDIEARVGLADSLGAAWALAHFSARLSDFRIAGSGEQQQAIEGLPVQALRLAPDIVEELDALGLKKIHQLIELDRAPLTARFGTDVAHRLDQALGIDEEPVSPHAPMVPYRVKKTLAEPISRHEDVLEGLSRLAGELVTQFVRDRKGARRLLALLYRVDGEVMRLAVGTSAPCCDVAHMMRLFSEKLDRLHQDFDAGFGIDALGLTALVTEEVSQVQAMVSEVAARGDERKEEEKTPNKTLPRKSYPKLPPELTVLMDRLGNRLGPQQVYRYAPRDSHIPERAMAALPVMAMQGAKSESEGWGGAANETTLRPLSILRSAEPVDVVAEVPEGPPRVFSWRKMTYRVARSQGPERVAPEWWQSTELTGGGGRTRDYFQVEDEEGRRFWLYRDGLYERETTSPRWYVGSSGDIFEGASGHLTVFLGEAKPLPWERSKHDGVSSEG